MATVARVPTDFATVEQALNIQKNDRPTNPITYVAEMQQVPEDQMQSYTVSIGV